ncbi:MAG: hypothetical protein ABL907_14745, partial [Hyphomicrobium sp.]
MTSTAPTHSARALMLSFRSGRWRWPWAILATITGIVLAVGMNVAASLLMPESLDGAAPEPTSLLRPGVLADYVLILCAWTLLGLSGLAALRLVKGDRPALAFTATGTFHARDFTKAAAAIVLVFAVSYL